MKRVFSFGNGAAEGAGLGKETLGGKGAGLAEMTSLGIPVPPGLHDHDRGLPPTSRDGASLDGAPLGGRRPRSRRLEHAAGKRFGDPATRSSSRCAPARRSSMPGMMDTILNLGLNDATVAGLARAPGNERFACDCYRRFIAMYGDVVLGVRATDEHAVRQDRSTDGQAGARGAQTRPGPRPADDLARDRAPRSRRSSSERTGNAVPRRPARAALGRDRRRLPVLEQPARRRLPQACTTSPTTGAPRSTCRRWSSATSATTPRPASRSRAIPRPASADLRRVAHQRAGRGRRRRHPHAAPARSDGDETRRGDACRAALRRARRASRSPRGALPRHAGPRVHDPGRKALLLQTPQRQAHRPGAVSIAVDMVDEGSSSTRDEAVAARRARAARPAAAPEHRSRSARPKAARSRKGLPAGPGAASGQRRLHRRRPPRTGGAGRAGHPRARRDLARGHPRHEGRARDPDRARRDDQSTPPSSRAAWASAASPAARRSARSTTTSEVPRTARRRRGRRIRSTARSRRAT